MIIHIKGAVSFKGFVVIKEEERPDEVTLAAESTSVNPDTMAYEEGDPIILEQNS